MALGLTPDQIIEKGTHPLLCIAQTWLRINLNHVATVQNGFAFPSKFFTSERSGMPLIRIRDINKTQTQNYFIGEYKDEFIVKKGDILIGMDGDFNMAQWKGVNALLNQRVCRVIPYSKYFDFNFLIFCLQPYLDAIHSETSAVTVKHLSSATINKIPLPLPPLPIQRAIVTKLESLLTNLDKGIENLEKAKAQLKIYRQAVLKKAFEGELTKTWRAQQTDLPTAKELLVQIKLEREKHFEEKMEKWKSDVIKWEENGKEGKKPVKPKKLKEISPITKSELGEHILFPNGCLRFDNYISTFDAGKSFRCEERPPSKEEVGVAKVSAVTWGFYNEEESKTCLDPLKVNTSYFIKRDDFIISRANTLEMVGNCVIAKKVTLNVMLSDKTLRMEFCSGVKSFFLHYLRSPYGRREIERRSTGNQDSMRNIGQDKIRGIVFPLFSEKEQFKIVEEIESRLSICDNLEEDITINLQKSKSLRQSILKKAFEGKLLTEEELTVCRAAKDYEPASVLLEKIKTEKAALEEAKKKEKKKKPSKTKSKKVT